MSILPLFARKPSVDQGRDWDYYAVVGDLLVQPMVLTMSAFPHHGQVNCLQHSMFVSYASYCICRRLGWDKDAAARGGLLHDLYLYDWHKKEAYHKLHGFTHPRAALRNAATLTPLSSLEEDIILKHMWPLTLNLWPRHRESMVVSLVDKLCSVAETLGICNPRFLPPQPALMRA